MTPGAVLCWAKCIKDGFVSDKGDSALELAMPVAVKTRDPFFRFMKKIGLIISFKV